MITNAIQGQQVCGIIEQKLNKLAYNPDLFKMLRNIEKMLVEISKKEVEVRRTRNIKLIEVPLSQVNDAIAHLEQLILIAQIMD